MADQPLPDRVPNTFKRFFWDVQFESLSPKEKPYYVINRLLDKGDLEAARWVVKTFPKDMIIHTFKTMRDCSLPTATFWSHYYGISQKEVRCMQEPYLSMRKMHWAY